MARFDGKKLKGIIGKTIMRKGEGDTIIIQSAPVEVRQDPASEKTAGLFGQGSALAAVIRHSLSAIIRGNYDPKMINRFNAPVRSVIVRSLDDTTGKFIFASDSFEDLIGFEFNDKSWLTNSLYVKPETSLTGNFFKISFPEINVKKQLKFPVNANLCELKVGVTFTALDTAMGKHAEYKSIEISNKQETVAPQEFSFEVPEGCLIIAAVGLNYFNKQDDVKTVMTSKTFNPANICGAVITAGKFVDPGPTKIGNTVKASPWQHIDKLKLHST